MYYNWSYLNRLAGRPTDRISGIYGKLKKEKARFSFRNGWEVPLAFEVGSFEEFRWKFSWKMKKTNWPVL